jgi:hypothetical protein
LSAKVKVTNIGKTTATAISGAVVEEMVPSGTEPKMPKRQKWFIPDKNGVPPKLGEHVTKGWWEATLYPNEVSEGTYSRLKRDPSGKAVDDLLTQPEIDAFNRQDLYTITYGEVWYSDIFGVRHWTRFCEQTPQKDGRGSRNCVNFGAVDSNQKKAKQ